MKLAQIAIGSILFIEALFLLYSPLQKYNVHSFFQLVKTQYQDCECMQKLSLDCIQSIRLILVSFILTGAYSLTFGSNVYVGLIAQLIWTITQSELYYSSGLYETRNTIIQIVLVLVLLSEVKNQWRQCAQRRQQHKIKCSKQQQETQAIHLKQESSSFIKQDKKAQKPQKEVKEVKQSAQKLKPKKKKNT